MAREDDVLSTYSLQSPPPSKKRKTEENSVTMDTTTPEKVSARNPFCLSRSNTDESINLRPLTKTLSPVKKPTMPSSSPMKTPTKLLSPVKKPNAKGAKRKLATTTLVLSRFFKKPTIKSDKGTDHLADNSDPIEIKEKFLHVKSLYETSVNDALSLYSDADAIEPNTKEQVCDSENTGTINGSEHNSVIEIISDTEDDQIAIKKTLNKFIHQKAVSILKLFDNYSIFF